MATAAIPAPDWVSFQAEKTKGLNLLGLRAPVQRIGNDLLNGVASLCLPTGRLPRQYLPQAAALRRVYHCTDLVARANPEQLSTLAHSLIVPQAEVSLTEKVPEIVAAMEQLLDTLADEESSIYALQGNGRKWHEVGSFL